MREVKYYKFRSGDLVEFPINKRSKRDITAMIFCLFLALAILVFFIFTSR